MTMYNCEQPVNLASMGMLLCALYIPSIAYMHIQYFSLTTIITILQVLSAHLMDSFNKLVVCTLSL